MKHLVFLILVFTSWNISAQDSENTQYNNSIGLSVKPNIFRPDFDGTPLLELNYRTNLKRENRFRLSLLAGLQDGEYGASLGWERLLYNSNRIKVYAGADLSYTNYSNGYLRSFGVNEFESNDIDLNIFGGVSYSATPRFDFFLEPNVMTLNIFTSNSENSDIGWNRTRFLQSSKIGIRMKF